MDFNKISDYSLEGKRVLIRSEMNVPIKNGQIFDDTRIRAALPTIEYCLKNRAYVILMAHLGRPTEGEFKPEDSLLPITEHLSRLLNQQVSLVKTWQQGVTLQPGQIYMLENVRLNKGEKKDSDELGKAYAALCDIYVNDAFGVIHRAEASNHAVAEYAPEVCAGFLLSAELDALNQAMEKPAKPLIAIVGGSKVSTKLTILNSLADKVDQLIVGGGIANTFLMAEGYQIGQSLAEPDLVEEAKNVINKIRSRGGNVPLPTDVVVATAFSEQASPVLKKSEEITSNEMILDIGPNSSTVLADFINKAGTIIWNGPVGVFEMDAFSKGTETLARAIASSSAFSIAGGGDTVAAITKFGLMSDISYISTGGGAFLELLEGKPLPAVDILQQRAKRD